MATSHISPIQYLRRIALLPAGGDLTDEHLLNLFIERQDDVAFEMLVRRHGPMVMGVCRRLLASPEDAEDAFQATFLVLVRKAHVVVPRAMVGNWLYGVARKAALKARAAASRRRKTEKQVVAFPEPQAEVPGDCWSDLRLVLDRELSRLAEKYRAPIILCDIERKTHKEAARQLGWPEGTLSVRLMRGRKMLAKRLNRSGVSLSVGTLVLVLCEKSALAAVPSGLLASTIKATSLWAVGQTVAAGMITGKVAALTQGVQRAMFLSKCKIAAAMVLAVSTLAVGGGFATHHPAVGQTAKAEQGGTQDALLAQKNPPDDGSVPALRQPASKPWAEKLFINKTTHEFGIVPQGAQLKYSVAIKNIYAVPLKLTKVETDCECVTATASKDILQPSEEGTVDIVMDASKFVGSKTALVKLTVGSNNTSTAMLHINAKTRTDVSIKGDLDFGPVTQGQEVERTVDIEYTGSLDWRLALTARENVPFEVTLAQKYRTSPTAGQPGKVAYTLKVKLPANAPIGTLRLDLFLKSNDQTTEMQIGCVAASVRAPL